MSHIHHPKQHKHHKHETPWILWPFIALWKLIALIIEMTGRLVGAILGCVLMLVGVILCLTIIGAVVGLPMLIIGCLLFIRSIF